MPYTRLQLANRALVKLQVVGAGQSPEDDDTDRANDIIPAMVADLEAREIYTVADIDDIEDRVFEWLAEYLAFLAAPDFGLPQDETRRQRAEYMMKRITATGPTFQPLAATYF